ncbi:hypothetical protein T4B_14029, partial [Trichinella pseudospiralis]
LLPGTVFECNAGVIHLLKMRSKNRKRAPRVKRRGKIKEVGPLTTSLPNVGRADTLQTQLWICIYLYFGWQEIFSCELMNTNFIAIFTLITDILVYGYNMKSYGALPVIHCFSCMSFSYQEHWSTMRYIYRRPELFTDRCNEPFMSRGIPLHNCTTICVTMKEPEIKGGLILGYNYIRGCADKVLISGFNRSALDTHRFPFVDVCRLLPRNQLINSRELNQIVVGDVHICGCYGNRCNGGGSRRTPTAPFILLVTFLLIAAHHHFFTSTYF